MRDFVTKVDSTSPPSGNLTAAEFNDYIVELENFVSQTNQVLDQAIDNQLLMGLANGGNRISKADASTADIGDIVLPANSSSALTVNLPNSDLFVGATVVFEPVTDQLYSVNSLTIGRNGNNIEDSATDFVMSSVNSDNAVVAAVFVGGSVGWKIIFRGIVGTTV